jgi:hypothetical protein
MPDVAIDRQSAITAFVAHLSGSILNWIAQDNADSRGYLVTRTREWLKLVRIPFNEQVVAELTKPTRAAKRPRPRSKSKAAGR